MEFEGKIAIVTGGANGIGRCIAEEFIARGTKAIIIDADKESGEMLQQKYNDNLFFYQGDIADNDVLEDFSRTITAKFGKIDYLINNAAISKKGILSGCNYEDFNYVLKIGVTAPYILTSLFLEHFNPEAAIVNISSTRAFMSQPDTESYSAAKGGITALTHSLSVSLAGKVRVNSISPGWIDTGAYQKEKEYIPTHSKADKYQHPVQRVGEPQDIARMVLYLCSKDAGFITGQNINIDGGMSRLMIYHDDFGWNYNPDN